MIAMVTYVPLYVQGVLGGTPTEAGSAITPMVIGWPFASAIGGRVLPRVGFRPLVRGGLAVSAVAAVALAIEVRTGRRRGATARPTGRARAGAGATR